MSFAATTYTPTHPSLTTSSEAGSDQPKDLKDNPSHIYQKVSTQVWAGHCANKGAGMRQRQGDREQEKEGPFSER